MRGERSGVDHFRSELFHLGNAQQAHVHLELIAQDLERVLDTVLAVRAERVQEPAPNADCARTQRQRLEHVRRATNTAVHEDVEVRVWPESAFPELLCDLEEDLHAGARHVKLSATVVREDDALNAGLAREDSVLPCRDTLQNDRHCKK